jgi:hypothetical protein
VLLKSLNNRKLRGMKKSVFRFAEGFGKGRPGRILYGLSFARTACSDLATAAIVWAM